MLQTRETRVVSGGNYLHTRALKLPVGGRPNIEPAVADAGCYLPCLLGDGQELTSTDFLGGSELSGRVLEADWLVVSARFMLSLDIRAGFKRHNASLMDYVPP